MLKLDGDGLSEETVRGEKTLDFERGKWSGLAKQPLKIEKA